MLILGIDPGTATTGFGIINFSKNSFEVLDWGLIETKKDTPIEVRLKNIYKETLIILKKYKPDVFVFEKIFFATNAKTVISVGQAQGVMLLATTRMPHVVVDSYAPGTIKKLITGSGRANKKDVQKSIRKFLGPKIKSRAHQKTHFDNSADALAIALTHALKNGLILNVNEVK